MNFLKKALAKNPRFLSLYPSTINVNHITMVSTNSKCSNMKMSFTVLHRGSWIKHTMKTIYFLKLIYICSQIFTYARTSQQQNIEKPDTNMGKLNFHKSGKLYIIYKLCVDGMQIILKRWKFLKLYTSKTMLTNGGR